MTIDTKTNEVKRLKPKRVRLEKEKLYEELQEHKIQLNIYKDENTRLKTQLKQLQKEQLSNEALAEELINSKNPSAIGRLSKTGSRPKGRVRSQK
jgi:hypothetical protein